MILVEVTVYRAELTTGTIALLVKVFVELAVSVRVIRASCISTTLTEDLRGFEVGQHRLSIALLCNNRCHSEFAATSENKRKRLGSMDTLFV